MNWTPISQPPKDDELILLYLKFPDGSRGIQQSRGKYIRLYDGRFEERGTTIGWMPAEPILNAPMGYDPTYGDDRLCHCGHEYVRHFDTYEGMAPVCCKYCTRYLISGVQYQAETQAPLDSDPEDWWKYVGVCIGFLPAEQPYTNDPTTPGCYQYKEGEK